ncbi:hypothetical protein K461DRAFT_277792 [Myriangium duriaei CBS 260.36]|uniref:Uncharacterized protein n=1 Tax=Myriangium duriaei CBS 260.36 TaxID=1168546 RepID=A0A9P4MKC8_9PEZI|nr:hypothetical protein K461DRAFT_277792 [Myriangium duriaei CBS 260.36]
MTQTSPLADNHGSKNHLPQPGQAETRSIDDNVLVPPPLSINKERSEARPEQEVAEQKRFEDVGHSEIIAKFPRPPTATQNTPKLAQFEEDDSNPVSATYTTQPSERVLDKQPVYWGVAVEEFPTDKNFNPPAAASTLSEIRYSLSSYEQAAKPKRAGTYSLERLLAAAESREGYDPNTSNIYRIGSDRVGLRAPTMVHPAFRRGE